MENCKIISGDAIINIIAKDYGVEKNAVTLLVTKSDDGSYLVKAQIYRTDEQIEKEVEYGIAHTAREINREFIRKILGLMKDTFSEDELKEIIEKYCDEGYYPKTAKAHNLVTGHATRLVYNVINRGGTDEEVRLALKYLLVCINSHKHKLSPKKFGYENGVWNLMKKYMPYKFRKKKDEKTETVESTTEDKKE